MFLNKIQVFHKMPELPEVETTCRGIAPHIQGQIIKQVIVRQPQLRWLVPETLNQTLTGLRILSVSRRAKYLLFTTSAGTMLVHLGMSGSLRIITTVKLARSALLCLIVWVIKLNCLLLKVLVEHIFQWGMLLELKKSSMRY